MRGNSCRIAAVASRLDPAPERDSYPAQMLPRYARWKVYSRDLSPYLSRMSVSSAFWTADVMAGSHRRKPSALWSHAYTFLRADRVTYYAPRTPLYSGGTRSIQNLTRFRRGY